MRQIVEYIKQTKEQRQAHLKLSEPCIERGGNSTQFKGLLAHVLSTTIPDGNRDKIVLAHACHNGRCSHPYHLYWATYAENKYDAVINKTAISPWQATVAKYGLEEAKKQNVRLGNKSGKGNKGKSKSPEHKAKIVSSINRMYNSNNARMVESVDTLDSKSSDESHGGSSPSSGTT